MDILLARALYGQMLVFADDRVIGHLLRSTGQFQEDKILEVVEFLSAHFGFKPEFFIDVGANIGTHLIFSLKSRIFSRAYGVEPETYNFRLLVANVHINNLEAQVKLLNVALSNNSSDGRLELSSTNFGDHRLRMDPASDCPSFGESEREIVQVKVITFDEAFRAAPIAWRRTLVWIDTQGHEGFIFNSGEQIFFTEKPYIVSEFWPYGLERSGGRDLYFNFLSRCRSIYDVNRPDWRSSSPLDLPALKKMYAEMLCSTTEQHHPHTDLLCIP